MPQQLKPMVEWVCDECGQVIAKADEGWVEWTARSDGTGAHDFRLVHHALASPRGQGGCYRSPDGRPGERSSHLHHALGISGMLLMLEVLEDGVRDPKEWSVFFKRLFLPYYEEARLDWPAGEDRDGYERALLGAQDPTFKLEAEVHQRIANQRRRAVEGEDE
jgi:hypothetical protein